ncbi:MAG TPA: MFS transporter, partial [Oscillatoriaceae cyanobacterium]
LPLSVGFLLMGPLSGFLSDRWGARWFTVGGLSLTVLGFLGLMILPLDFAYWQFAVLLVVLGVGLGMFGAPNTASIMNASPPDMRGVASGMRATFQNTAMTLSITLIFTLVTIGLAGGLPVRLYQGLTSAGVPTAVAIPIAHLPPTGALFAAFLGYNPLATLLPPSVLAGLAPAAKAHLLSQAYFPTLIAAPFKSGVAIAFAFCAIVSLIAAIASSFRSSRVPKKRP